MGRPATLKVDIIADAKRVASGVGEANRHFSRLGGAAKTAGLAMAGGLAVAGVAAVGFGASSVRAYAEAQASQARLTDALARYPRTADVTRAALDKLNTSLAQKTRFDDDSLASGQAVLAQYKLTGTQISQLTPLLADYAAKTGKDVPTAAGLLGKALLGKGKALADIGVKFKDTGTITGNYNQLMGGLRKNVGGFAATEGKTAAGQVEILKNKFGEWKESIGGALLPVLTGLMTFISDNVLPLLGQLSPVVDFVKTAFGGLSAGFTEGDVTSDGLFGKFEAIGKTLRENLLPAVQGVAKGLRDFASFIVKEVVPKVLSFWGTLAKSLIPVVKDLANFFSKTLLPAIKSVIRFIVDTVVPGMQKTLKPIIEGVGKVVHDVTSKLNEHKDSFKKLWEALKPIIKFIAEKVAPVIGKVLGDALNTVGTAIGGVIDGIALLIDGIAGAINKIKELVNYIKNSGVGKTISGIAGGIGKLNPFSRVAGTTTVAGGETAGGTVINIYGALDPVAVGRQLEDVFRGNALRLGRAPVIGLPA